MADNVTLDPGAGGAIVATDQINSNEHVQYVKLMDGTADSSAKIPGDATNGLDVDVTRLPSGTVAGSSSLPAGTNAIGKLAANSGVDIGDVDVTSMPATAADGAAGLPATTVVISGYDGTNVQAIVTDSAGRPQVGVNGTVAVSAASLPLPSGAATSAKQPALGTAGTPSADVLTVQGAASMTALKVDGSAVTQPVSGTVTADTELPAAAALADGASNPTTPTAGAAGLLFNGTTWDRVRGDTTNGLDVDVTRLPALVAGSALVGRVNVDPQTANGLTPSVTISANSTNATSVKGSAGQVYWIYCSNTNAAVRYLKLYNKASAPTVGTDTPVLVFAIPGNTAAAGFSTSTDMGLAFGTGIAFALTTGVANSDTGAVAQNEIVVNLGYK